MLKTIRLLFTFYKGYWIPSIIITLFCIYFFKLNGESALGVLLWFKLLTLGLFVFFIENYKKKEFYYYQNLGISKSILWISTLVFDFALFVVLIILVA